MMNEREVRLWAPSIRALCHSNTYEEYLLLLAKYEQEIIDSVDLVFLNGEDL